MITPCRLGFGGQNKGDYPKSTTITLRLPSIFILQHTSKYQNNAQNTFKLVTILCPTHIPKQWVIEFGHERNEF